MKTKYLSLLIVFAIVSNITPAKLSLQNGRTKTFQVKKGGELTVNVNPGDVSIDTWDKEEVSIRISGIDDEEIDDVQMKQQGNTISVRYNTGWGWTSDASFLITVPTNFHVRVNTSGGDIDIVGNMVGRVDLQTSGGDISAKNIQGQLSINTSGGDINIGRVNGQVNANTNGGDIKVEAVNGESAGFTTMGGDVTIGSAESKLNVKTFGGDIEIGDIGSDAIAVTFGGDIKLKNVSGSAKMETYGGNLYLGSADGKVNADTKGGNITLKKVKGSVDAKTAGGDVSVELIPSVKGESSIKSSHGDIELLLPSTAKVTIDAQVKIRGNWSRSRNKYKIISDFGGAKDSAPGDKDLSSTIHVNGGGEKIILRTINSDIKIVKIK